MLRVAMSLQQTVSRWREKLLGAPIRVPAPPPPSPDVGTRRRELLEWADRLGMLAEPTFRARSAIVGDDELEAALAARQRYAFAEAELAHHEARLLRFGPATASAHVRSLLNAVWNRPAPEAARLMTEVRAWVASQADQLDAEIAHLAADTVASIDERLDRLDREEDVVDQLRERARQIAAAPTVQKAREEVDAVGAELDLVVARSVRATERRLRQEADATATGWRAVIAWLRDRQALQQIIDLGPTSPESRPATTLAIASLAVAALLLLRPTGWAMVGGYEGTAFQLNVPRLILLGVPVLTAAGAVATTVGLAELSLAWTGAGRLAARSGAALIGLIAMAASAGPWWFTQSAASTVVGEDRSGPAVMMFVAIRLTLFVGVVAALVGIVLVLVLPRRPALFAPAIAAGFVCPALAYLVTLLQPPTWEDATRVPYPFGELALSSELATDILVFGVTWAPLAALVAYWQAATWAQALARFAVPVAERLPVPVAVMAVLATAKVVYGVAGFSHALPSWAGGEAQVWDLVNSMWVWPATVLAFGPLLVVVVAAARRIRTDPESLAGIGAALAIILSVGAIAQVGGSLLTNLVPVQRRDFDDPLWLSARPALVIATVVVTGLAVGLWRTHRAAALLCALVVPFVASSALLFWTERYVPVVGPWHLDLVVSGAVAVAAWAAVLRRPVTSPAVLVTVLVVTTIVSHGQTLVPAGFAAWAFPFTIVATVVFALIIGARPRNQLIQRQPAFAPIILGTWATVLSLAVGALWIGERGQGDNALFFASEASGGAAQRMIAYPVIILCVAHACWRMHERWSHP